MDRRRRTRIDRPAVTVASEYLPGIWHHGNVWAYLRRRSDTSKRTPVDEVPERLQRHRDASGPDDVPKARSFTMKKSRYNVAAA